MIKRSYFLTILMLFLMVVSSGMNPLLAQKDHANDKAGTYDVRQKPADVPHNAKDQAERAQEAANVLGEIMAIPEGGISDEMMEHAMGIAVIPHVVKGALGIGGSFGKGLMSQRLASGEWSAPTFVEISGGNFGLQLGVSATDLVLVFTNKGGIDSLLKGKVKLGADASVAAGPVGRNAGVGTDVKLNSAVYSYSRSKGLFAGLALDGSVISIDDSSNQKAYGKKMSAESIVASRASGNAVVQPFLAALQKYSPANRVRPTQ